MSNPSPVRMSLRRGFNSPLQSTYLYLMQSMLRRASLRREAVYNNGRLPALEKPSVLVQYNFRLAAHRAEGWSRRGVAGRGVARGVAEVSRECHRYVARCRENVARMSRDVAKMSRRCREDVARCRENVARMSRDVTVMSRNVTEMSHTCLLYTSPSPRD